MGSFHVPAHQAQSLAGTGAEGSPDASERLLLPSEVSAMFGVTVKAVRKWAAVGYLTKIRTPGGHHRYRESEVCALLDAGDTRERALASGNEAAEIQEA